MEHEIFIENDAMFGGLWPNDREKWPAEYTGVFGGNTRGICVDAMGPKGSCVWVGMHGTCYRANAFLPSPWWNEAAASRFANWRFALFAPEKIDVSKPIVFFLGGIGMDFTDGDCLIPHIVGRMGCIFVTLDRAMTGIRNLVRDYASTGKNLAEFPKFANGGKFGVGPFKSMTCELSFNVRQLTEVIARMYGIPHRRFAVCGFSMGTFFAHQIAFSQPNCIGVVGGCGFPDVKHYVGLVPRISSNAYASFIATVAHVFRQDYDIAEAFVKLTSCAYYPNTATRGQSYTIVLGSDDPLLAPSGMSGSFHGKEAEREYCATLASRGASAEISVAPGGHGLVTRDLSELGKSDCVGTRMLIALEKLVSK